MWIFIDNEGNTYEAVFENRKEAEAYLNSKYTQEEQEALGLEIVADRPYKEYRVWQIYNQDSFWRPDDKNWKGEEIWSYCNREYGSGFGETHAEHGKTMKVFYSHTEARDYFEKQDPFTRFNDHYVEMYGWHYEETLLDEDGDIIEVIDEEDKFQDYMPYEYCIREKKTEEILGVYKDLDDAVKGLADQEAYDKYHDLYEPDSYEIEEFNPEIWDFDPDRASNIGSDDIDIW